MTTVCAQCGSRLRPEDAWCSLCFAPRAGAGPSPGVPREAPPEVPPKVSREVPREPAPESDDAALPEGWEDGVVLTNPRPAAGNRSEALASADRLIAQLAVSERAAQRGSRLGRLQSEVAARTGLAPGGAGAVIGAAGGVALLLGLIVVLTVLGLLL